MAVKVSVLEGRLDRIAGEGDDEVLVTYETDRAVEAGDTLKLEDGTPVVVIGIRDRVDASDLRTPHQLVTVGTYFDVLDGHDIAV